MYRKFCVIPYVLEAEICFVKKVGNPKSNQHQFKSMCNYIWSFMTFFELFLDYTSKKFVLRMHIFQKWSNRVQGIPKSVKSLKTRSRKFYAYSTLFLCRRKYLAWKILCNSICNRSRDLLCKKVGNLKSNQQQFKSTKSTTYKTSRPSLN